jgi:hypothetical protein
MIGRRVNAIKLVLVLASLCAAVSLNSVGGAPHSASQSDPAQQPPPPPKSDPTPQTSATPAAAPTQTPTGAPPAGGQGGGGALAELQKMIAGREEQPAEQVFKNIQVMKGVPAGRFLRIMQLGYARSLGVNCAHCHVPGQWESDEKPTKGIAREMILMMRAINNDILKKIKNLKSESPAVNCTTCHRGETKPALNLPEPQRPSAPQPPTPMQPPTPQATPRP